MSFKPPLIGLSGKSGSGKSTAADYLTREYGYHQFAFAGALKQVVQTAFHFTAAQLEGDEKEKADPRFGKSPRWCLQYLGTEVFRTIWPEIWIWNLRRDLLDFLSINGQRPCVVTDVRFRDEAEALKKIGAILVRLDHPDLAGCPGGILAHASENQLDYWEEWDHYIENTGTKEQLFAVLDEIVNLRTS